MVVKLTVYGRIVTHISQRHGEILKFGTSDEVFNLVFIEDSHYDE